MSQAAALARQGRVDPPARLQAPSYLDIFLAGPLERIAMIKRGVGAKTVKQLLAALDIPQAAGLAALNLPAATVNRKVALDQPLSSGEGERVLGLAGLIGQLQAMVRDAGDGEGFDVVGWMSHWLRTPVPALGGAEPLSFIDTMEGQALVSQLLAQMQSGAYA